MQKPALIDADYSAMVIPSSPPIPVDIVPKGEDGLFHGLKTCPRSKQIKKDAKLSKEYLDKQNEANKKLFPEVNQYLREEILDLSTAK